MSDSIKNLCKSSSLSAVDNPEKPIQGHEGYKSSVKTVALCDKVVTFPGISIVSVGHISGAHFNPSVTIAFATCKRFPWKQVPAYVAAQVLGSTLAAGTLRLLFSGKQDHFVGTVPAGSDMQSFVMEFIITFYLMFIVGTAVAFGLGVGLKDGVGKATEFFAGFLHELLLFDDETLLKIIV
ncbi:hypothetical protein Q3G72_014811 [Acer saccharum]|nr:hypothetical protein Q3G72_014811 [Acer saccharum]